MNLEVPIEDDAVSASINHQLLGIVANQLLMFANPDIETAHYPINMTLTELEKLFHSSFSKIDSNAKADYDEYISYCDKGRVVLPDDRPQWYFCINIDKIRQTENYIVFSSSNYSYMGGAHGSHSGAGSLTFDKKNCIQFRNFIKERTLGELQPIIRKGLLQYFADTGDDISDRTLDEYLFDHDGPIAIPTLAPCPEKDGLTFTYQQYEIAPYACGIPSFTVPYEEIKPFLTREAIILLGLDM